MKENIHKGHRDRLRTIIEKTGLENIPEHQVLEFLLTFVIPRKDTNPIAHNLIKKFGSLSGVLDANKNELMTVDGIGEKTAALLASLTSVFSCYKISKGKTKPKLSTTHEAYLYIKPFLQYKTVEELYLLCVDNKNNLMSMECLSKGVCNGSTIDIQKITTSLIRSKCCNFIMAHNHPRGQASPSFEDDKFTRAVMVSSLLNGFNFLDHLIVGADDYFSYGRCGNLDKYKEQASGILGERNMAKQQIGSGICTFDVKK